MRKYVKDHIVKALQSFDEVTAKSTNFGVPLDSHIRDYAKKFKSRIVRA